jgi:hypothetical protein
MEVRLTTQTKAPGYLPGFAFLWLSSAAVAAFGVAGWALSDGNVWQRAVLGTLTACSAGVIPFTVVALGRSAASTLLVLPILVFGAINAYSFHHTVEVLVEAPRKAAHMAEGDADYATAKAASAAAKARLEALAPLALDPTMPKGRVEAQKAAWEAQQRPLVEAVAQARTDEATAKAARDAARGTYKPLAPDWLVWALAVAVDFAIAVGIWGLEATRNTLARRLAAARIKAEHVEAASELDAAVADQIETAGGSARQTAQILRLAATRLRQTA